MSEEGRWRGGEAYMDCRWIDGVQGWGSTVLGSIVLSIGQIKKSIRRIDLASSVSPVPAKSALLSYLKVSANVQ